MPTNVFWQCRTRSLTYAEPFSLSALMRVIILIKRNSTLGLCSHFFSLEKHDPNMTSGDLIISVVRRERRRVLAGTSIKTYRSLLLLLVVFGNAENCFALVGLNLLHPLSRFSAFFELFL